MRSVKMAAFVALLAGGMAFGASQIAYTLELGGNNNAAQWEADNAPAFTSGVISGTPQVMQGDSITWAVRVTVSGTHEDPGGPGDTLTPLGAANLVFDLVLKQGGSPVAVQAAAISCSSGTPGNPGALICEPSGAGFWSSINDGDADGARGDGGASPDLFANGSFAIGLPGAMRVIDAIPGPNMDYGWYPSAGNRGGIPTSGGTPAGSTSAGDGELLGFGAGYKNYDFGTTYLPGVGMAGVLDPPFGDCGTGFGEDLPLFEGQISTIGLSTGVYTLELIPGANGNNIIHQGLNCFDMNYGGWGSFATQVNSATGGSMDFEVIPGGAEIVASHVFYNGSYYDGNSALLNANDNNAIDPGKALLASGTSSFANYTGSTSGITGLMFDVANASPAPVQGDFAFDAMGFASTGSPVSKDASVSAFAVDAGGGVSGSDRVKFAFTPGSIVNTWLRVTVGTGFGLQSPAVLWIGNQKGESNTPASGKALVNATDFNDTKNPANAHGPFNRAPVDDWYDVNKDSLVNATDLNQIRAAFSGPFNSIVTPITK